MKSIDAQALFEILGDIDEELLEEACDIDDAKKLKELKKKQESKIFVFTPLFKRITAICVCVALIVVAVVTAKLLSDRQITIVNNQASSQQGTLNQPSTENEGAISSQSGNSSLSSDHSSKSVQSNNNDSANQSNFEANNSSSSGGIVSSENTESNIEQTSKIIKSMDELNFYTAKKIIADNSIFPISNTFSVSNVQTVKLDDDKIYYYQIDRNTKFTISMVTYFTININTPSGFLAQKLGGTGLAEVVITQNSFDDMITFKKGDKYYSCLWDSASYKTYSDNSLESVTFSTHKYIEGFNLVKNLQQENFQFTVFFEGSKVTGIECDRYNFNGKTTQYIPDDITVTDDYCIVMYVKQSITIDQLEGYVINNGFKEDEL